MRDLFTLQVTTDFTAAGGGGGVVVLRLLVMVNIYQLLIQTCSKGACFHAEIFLKAKSSELKEHGHKNVMSLT